MRTPSPPRILISPDLVWLPNRMNLHGSINLDSFPGLHSATNMHDGMDDYPADDYLDNIPNVGTKRARPEPDTAPPTLGHDYPADDNIPVIPNVRSFGTKRARSFCTKRARPQPNTAPPTLGQAIAPRTGDADLQQPSLVVELSATEKPGTPIVLRGAKVEVMECVQVTDRETQLRLYEELQRVVADQKLECVKVADGFREDIAQKETLITTLQTEIGALKDKLLMKQSQDSEKQVRRRNREIADARDQASQEKEELLIRSRNDIQDLKDSGERLVTTLQNEIGALKDELLKRNQDSLEQVSRHNKELADVRDEASREKEELMMRSQREIQNLKDSVREETELRLIFRL